MFVITGSKKLLTEKRKKKVSNAEKIIEKLQSDKAEIIFEHLYGNKRDVVKRQEKR